MGSQLAVQRLHMNIQTAGAFGALRMLVKKMRSSARTPSQARPWAGRRDAFLAKYAVASNVSWATREGDANIAKFAPTESRESASKQL